MAPPEENGPDGSSLMTHPPEPGIGLSPPRAVSPAPKPERLREVKTVQENTYHAPAPRPPPKPRADRGSVSATYLPLPQHELGLRASTRSLGPPPPLSPKPTTTAPSVMIEPPHSPPKHMIAQFSRDDAPSLLNPDYIVAPTTPSVPSRSFKIPSRTSTPTLEPRKSPMLTASRPPSPPPPRRSGEMRREKPPPPISRNEKPLIPAQRRTSVFADPIRLPEPRRQPQETSPFNSPPSSPGSPGGDTPPLPSRPRPHVAQTDVLRPRKLDLGFEPPPLHHSLVTKRQRDNDMGMREQMASPHVNETKPALPTRPLSQIEPPPRPAPLTSTSMMPPPRPARQGSAMVPTQEAATLPKRIVSTPTTGVLPPPTRVPGRSNTVVDRSLDRSAPPDVRSIRTSAPAQASSALPSTSNPAAQPPITKSDGVNPGSTYPDPSNTNRRAPSVKQGLLTRVWSLRDGELLMSFAHGEGVKATSIAFKPGSNVDEEGQRLWIGTNMGEVMEADIATQSIVAKKATAHARHEVIKIYRHYNELWTLDESGTLAIWGPDEDHTPNLNGNPHQTYRLPRTHAFSMVVGDLLWHATGKEIRIFAPTLEGETQFQVLIRPLVQDSAGEVTSGTLMRTHPTRAFFGHIDGKVSIYNTKDFSCLAVLSISGYKINSLTGVGDYIWAGFNNGKISVYDISQTPWTIKKEWQAHENPVVKIISDPSSCYRIDRLQVISLGADNVIRVWDGLLQEDWQEDEMKAHEAQYCDFEDIKALVMTWNAGASTPHSLRYADQDATFIRNLLQSSDSPDILIFGFQELVDLEDKTATAKRFFKSKKKEGSDQERMSHQYRDWRDFLMKSLDDHMPRHDLYHLLHTATLVGLFTCIFVKSSLRDRIRNLSASEVKRGMGGLHGNKGAIVVRFLVDDTSMCFINCHLAAGQSQANSRHNDIAAILETPLLPAERDPNKRIDSYTGGGDGTLILDHELCVLNGDLNYRIDTMSRDTVVMAVKQNNLAKLLERDQLLVARRRNPGFRLRAFEELPIKFAPTYKYDVGTDDYDTSEKRRSPAWCDRLLYRGRGRIKQLDYVRHEVRVSDHRPVTGRFRFTVKRIDPRDRAVAWMDCQVRFEDLRAREENNEKMAYLMHVIGYDTATAKSLAKPRRDRSPSRTRA
ncbi:type I inositol-1,4,5-trisphosphate 5-phosphatase CVP2 [Verticillium dahliae VdLs.17]|uniref:Type I inositol-1,4,5-trisphosphate 5-phosphatase CVP2 n=1 Tax=Verticillium dahliae (strain VdLs.17 / ATCC MYA-4575 / FGSC 10137) TaxID=498257 RepID=G2WU00_VERDV|nr:type I inositol-1,4,5-trisphosphate 5-phosphatase CVP2 [Verticillium dahliae VdLs.17]EGY17591.1 type I inositol-1,4,5-trisphosphate 5-phosphatase CVP2 [Verticillium dahliae VdLs.17]